VGLFTGAKDDIFDSIRNAETAIGEYERRAEQSRVEAKARYLDWMDEEDEKSGFSFRLLKNVLRQDPPDYRKAFDEASESLEALSSCDLSTLSDRSLREDIDLLKSARSSFKDYLFQDSDVRRITITVLDHFGGIDQISSHSLYIIKML